MATLNAYCTYSCRTANLNADVGDDILAAGVGRLFLVPPDVEPGDDLPGLLAVGEERPDGYF